MAIVWRRVVASSKYTVCVSILYTIYLLAAASVCASHLQTENRVKVSAINSIGNNNLDRSECRIASENT